MSFSSFSISSWLGSSSTPFFFCFAAAAALALLFLPTSASAFSSSVYSLAIIFAPLK
jgi:hypothetical protein